MSEEKKCMKNELCEEVTELSMEDLEQVTGGAGPSYTVDDAPMTNGMKILNPADIESMTVLKDASSTAIYASKAIRR